MEEKSITKMILIEAGIAILIIVPLFLSSFYLRFLISETTAQIIESRKEFSQKSVSLNSFVKLQFEYKNFGKSYLNVLYNIVPQKDELINISKKLQTVAVKNNLSFEFSYTGEKNATAGEFGYVSFIIRVAGESMNQINEFIKDLNEFQYLNKIETLSIKNKNTKENEERVEKNIEASIKGKVYFRKNYNE